MVNHVNLLFIVVFSVKLHNWNEIETTG